MVDKTRRVIFIAGLALFVAVVLVVVYLVALGVWLDSKSYESQRENHPTHVLLVGLDTRPDEAGGLPDAMVLLDLRTMAPESIPRDWETSVTQPKAPLIQKYFGLQDCKTFCGIVGIYVFPQLAEGKDPESLKSEGLEALRRVVGIEYGIKDLAVIAVDLAWARSYFRHLGPIKVEVKDPIPVGGTPINGQLVNIARSISPGLQALSGSDLYWFARAREGTSNESRMARQLQLVREMLAQRTPSELLSTALQAKGYVLTDLNLNDLAAIFIEQISQ